MILTDYYKFEKLPNQKSKLRIDCTASTRSYPDFETIRNKSNDLFVYIGDNTHTKAGEKRKSDLAISKTHHISSLYFPDVKTNLAFGDVKGTADAILFILTDVNFTNGAIDVGGIVEMFVVRGKRNNRNNLYNMLADGELQEEIARLREQSISEQTLL